MIIVITSNTSWYIYNFRKNTIKSLIDCGHAVYAIAPRDNYSARLEQLGCIFVHISIDQGGTNPLKDIFTFFCFFKFYLKIKPNVILNFTPKNNIYSTLAASFFKISCINNVSGLGFLFINDSFSSKIVRLLYKISQPLAHTIFFQNEDDRNLFLQHKLAPECITDRIPGSGVDLSRFQYSPVTDNAVIKFILVGRMLYDKGVREYVAAAKIILAKYSHVKFYLLGFLDVKNPSAVSRDDLDKWVAEGVVEYLGVSDAVEDVMIKSDCIVLPSYREGTPKSLLEACALGRPIITTDTIGCKDVVSDRVSGFLCQPRDYVDLANKMEQFILMPYQKRLVMGYEGRLKIERDFDEQIVINKYLDAIAVASRG